ncbi:HEXXH motif-containing putative peptide modification protein [Rhodococcus sp. A14]|uniref:aKG-HExxH-type peptide beta-hydroxylase n=1 Tax=Rhodococcus sp. A14 TaxID=1194106 RepID=UPI0014224AE1|nr:hypothetical protein [Rhodococcus sp. A14]
MARVNLLAEVGGLPFLDGEFRASRLLSAVCAVRAWREGVHDRGHINWSELKVLLLPEYAIEANRRMRSPADIASEPLSADEQADIDAALEGLAHDVPEWEALLKLPVRVKRLVRSEAMSCSCFFAPQHIYISPRAFSDEVLLGEYLLHELCHNWTYLLEELEPLQTFQALERFTLPSGTQNKQPTELLGAAYVSATLVRWYRRRGLAGEESRINLLTRYLDGCLDLIDDPTCRPLTPTGLAVAFRLIGERR